MRLEDGGVLRLYRQTIEDFCLYSGLELSEEDMDKLRKAAGEMSAKMRAVRIVSASSVSKRDLEQRLVHKGEDPKHAKQAVQWMSDLHLLDDTNTARQIVDSCARKGYGVGRAKQMLYEKRIPRELWEEALAEYPDQTEHIIAFLQTRLADDRDPRELRRAMDALIRRGHSYCEIRRGLQMLSLDGDFQEEE